MVKGGPSAAFFVSVGAACLGTGPALSADLAWPPAPESPRIVYSDSFPAPARVSTRVRSLASRIFRFVVGISDDSASAVSQVFLRPTGIWVSGPRVYVADPGLRRVVCYDTASGVTVPLRLDADPELSSPVGVVVTDNGSIIVSDSALGKVLLFGATGKLVRDFDRKGRHLVRPTGLALDEAKGKLFVADTGAHCIHVFGLDGTHLASWGGRGGAGGSFNYPTYIWADRKRGELLVTDSANFRVQVLGYDGKFRGEFGENGNRPGYLPRPRGVARDSDGNIYLTDGALEAVQIFDGKGRLLLWFGESGADHGKFSLPGGVFIDGKDLIYVADTANARVEVFRYLGGKG